MCICPPSAYHWIPKHIISNQIYFFWIFYTYTQQNFDGMIHGIWLQIPFWIKPDYVKYFTYFIYNVVYKFQMRKGKKAIIDIFDFNIEILATILLLLVSK